MWYIFNNINQLIAISDGEPDQTDLQSRNEFFVYSIKNIPFNKVGYDGQNLFEISESDN
jgi:hypothetical protein